MHTTYPGRKDTMVAYVTARHPHLAPFSYFRKAVVR